MTRTLTATPAVRVDRGGGGGLEPLTRSPATACHGGVALVALRLRGTVSAGGARPGPAGFFLRVTGPRDDLVAGNLGNPK
jgi:hypothetical protein